MNPYYVPPYMQQPQVQLPQSLPQQMDPRLVYYFVDTAEQLSTITPMPNTIYLGISRDGGKIFQRRISNDGLVEMKTFSLQTDQTRKTDTQEILGRLAAIEKKIGVVNESNVIDVTE